MKPSIFTPLRTAFRKFRGIWFLLPLFAGWLYRRRQRASSHPHCRRNRNFEPSLKIAPLQIASRQLAPIQAAPSLRPDDYAKLFRHAHDAILILDPDEERVLEANQRACELYGFTRNELIGRSMLELTPAHARATDHVQPTLESRDRYSFETIQTRKDSSEIWLEIHAATVEFRGRKAILSINRDVTERRRRQQALAQHRTRLEATVRDRTARLEEVNRALQRKNTELENFTYAVAHGFKSPLVTIRGYLSLLDRAAAAQHTDQIGHGIERIQGATQKMGELIDHLLELSRAGRVVDRPAAVSLGELVAETVDLLSGVIDERGVEVVSSSRLPTLYGDRSRLEEVLRILVENAVKYMGSQPEPRIEIRGHRARQEILVEIRDNGIGLEVSQQTKIFDFFERTEASTAEGTGIGLALAQRIIEVHGGRIWVESAGRGQGSTFRFTLPVEQQLELADGLKKSHA